MLQSFHLFDRSLELTDVGFQAVGNEFCYIVRNVQVEQFCLAANDGDPGFKIRNGDVGDQTAFKPGANPFFQRFQLSWRLIGRDDDLLVFCV